MNFCEEIEEIISYYLVDDGKNFCFLDAIRVQKNNPHEKNTLLINSTIQLALGCYQAINEYKTIILSGTLYESSKNNKIIQIKSDINHWTFNLNMFDNIINIFNLNQIIYLEKFLQIMFFALKNGGKLNFITHSKNNFHNLSKKLIDLDSQFHNQKIIQRFNLSNNVEKISGLLQSYKFTNITIIKENLLINYKNINDFLFDENFASFFTKDHFLYSDHIKNNLKNDPYEEELEILIIKCTKN